MITLFNPTNEVIVAMHGGRNYALEPKVPVEMEDVAANHILNTHGQRGVCRLKFGDDLQSIAVEGLARAKEFKKRQVMNHNQMNISRMQVGLNYVAPTADIKQYAQELEMVLDEPLSTQRNEKADDIALLKAQNASLQQQLADLMSMVEGLVATPKTTTKGANKDDPK